MSKQNLAEMLAAAEAEATRLAGSATLRPFQREVLSLLAAGKHTFACLPTGYGKSLCFWMPAAAWRWKVWVVSPLLALIEDQSMAMTNLGLRVVAWSGLVRESELRASSSRMEDGDWDLCFLTPERLVQWEKNGYLRILRNLGQAPDLLVLDEMHCLEEWRGFRAAYSELFAVVRRLTVETTLLLGLSASLSEENSHAWMRDMCDEHVRVGTGLGRPNLSLRVLALELEEIRWMLLLSLLRALRRPDSALVYCASRDEADELAQWLRSAGLDAVAYHAGLPTEVRSSRSRSFREGLLRIVCCTSAFGMGIDYAYVSLVVHFSLPHDLESYWQEVGRAGRSGREAFAWAFWRRSEVLRARRLEGEAKQRYFALWQAWAAGKCRKQAVAERFGFLEGECGKCDRCLRESSVEIFMPVTEMQVDPLQVAWWVRPEAQLQRWTKEKFFPEAKDLDGS